MPTVSVVMPVYNTPLSYLREATESILQQTYTDFEFIIVDDHSNEETVAYLSSLTDARIRILRNSENLGITKSLNKGFAAASGKYIARMDADDISVPTRLEKQVRFMEDHPDVIVCGTAAMEFAENGVQREVFNSQIGDMEEFRCRLLFAYGGPLHPTTMFNSALLEKYHICYDEEFQFSQDYNMWVTCSAYGKIRVIDEVLLFRRVHEEQVSASKHFAQAACEMRVRMKQLERLVGSVSERQKEIHERCHNRSLSPRESWKWLKYLEEQNKKTEVYDRDTFKRVIRSRQQLQEMARYNRAREEKGMPFLPAFILYAPLKYKISKCCSVFASVVKRISVRSF